jgi:hypothetical protein
MTTRVLHPPRVAWDLARTTVAMAAAAEDRYRWFEGQIEQRLGLAFARELRRTRERMYDEAFSDVRNIELGRWRVRIEDVLLEDPLLAEDLTLLRLDANSRLAG